jgi:hypothetical protein
MPQAAAICIEQGLSVITDPRDEKDSTKNNQSIGFPTCSSLHFYNFQYITPLKFFPADAGVVQHTKINKRNKPH